MIRRKWGGEWIIDENSKRLLSINGLAFFPISYIYQRITGQQQKNVKRYFAEIAAMLSSEPTNLLRTKSNRAEIAAKLYPQPTNIVKPKSNRNWKFASIVIILAFVILSIFSGVSYIRSENRNKINSDEIIQTAIVKTELASNSIPIATTPPVMTLLPTSSSIPSQTLTPTQDNSKQLLINAVIPLLDIGTTESYTSARTKLGLFQRLNQKNWNDEEIQTLYWYADSMIYILAGEDYLTTFQYISPNYDGVYHDHIMFEVLKHMSEIEWEQQYESNHPIMETAEATYGWPIGRLPPAIGMTAQQVRESQWGEPQDINKTITANSISEQWVYGNGKYIYLENGIVVSIQE